MVFLIWDQSDGQKWYFAMRRQHVDATLLLLEHVELARSVLVNDVEAWDIKGQNCIFKLNNWHVADGIFKDLYMI